MSGNVIGVDLGTRHVRVVVGEKRGAIFVLKRAVQIDVPHSDDPESGALAALKDARAALGKEMKSTAGARFGLSGKDLIVRYTSVPRVPIWRLRLLMEFEVGEMSRQAGGALASDYNLVSPPDAKDAEETVLVAVCKETFLDARYGAMTASFGEPKAGTPASIALFNAFASCGDIKDGEYAFLVDVGDKNVEIVLQKDGELLFARNLSVGGSLLTEAIQSAFGVDPETAEEAKHDFGNVAPRGGAGAYGSGKEEKVANAIIGPVGRLSSSIQSMLAFARAQTKIKDLNVGRILLSGGGANLRGLTEYLSAAFKCPVERFLPENGLDLSKLPEDEARAFQDDPGSWATALGLARTSSDDRAFKIDILPAAAKKRRDFKNRTLFMILAGVVAAGYLAYGFVDLSGRATKAEAEASAAARRAERTKALRKRYDAEQALLKDLNDKSKKLSEATETAFALARTQRLVQQACPEGVWIESFTVRRENVMVDSSDPTKGKEPRTLVYVAGQATPQFGAPDKQLHELETAIQSAQPGCRVSIVDQKTAPGGGGVLDFRIVVDLLREGTPAS
jgi:type IV pilus assembly protein PilM